MLFRILKLFGLDVPARIEAVTANLEYRLERVIGRLSDVAQQAVLLVILGAAAVLTALMAVTAGLVAIYRLTADAYGDYAGLSAVAAILIVVTLILVALMMASVQSLTAAKMTTISPTSDAGASAARGSVPAGPAIPVSAAPASVFNEEVSAFDAAAFPLDAPPSASDLIEPLTYILSDVIKFPTFGKVSVDQFIDKLRVAARTNADETVHRAANVVRYGSRIDLVFVLGGTAAVAWLVTRNASSRA